MNKLVYLFVFLFSANLMLSETIEQEIEFYNDSIKLSGTLSLPDTLNAHPAILLISGSGQQNRDEEIFGFKPFKIISEYLVKEGFAVLRYDDRGVGKSKNKRKDLESATTADFALDALAGIDALYSNKNIDNKRIGILGHSEGAIISAMLASKYPDKIAFIIMMGGPSISGAEIVNFQVANSNRQAGMSEDAIAIALKYQNELYAAFAANKSPDEIQNILYRSNYELIDYFPEAQKSSITNKEEYAKSMAYLSLKQANSAWFRFFTTYNPANALKSVICPTLAIYGAKDTQVPPSLNIAPLQSYYQGKDSILTIVNIESANHLFQKANTGSVAEYQTLDKSFTPEFLESISKWLNNNNFRK